MLGEGAYDRHSSLQAGVVRLAASRLELAVRALLPPTPRRPLRLVDYGSATGKNAVAAMQFLRATLVRLVPDMPPLELGFCDQADNDWKALASRVHDAFAADDDVRFALYPRSFYGPVLPPDSVDLGWSAIAVHWLSDTPAASVDRLWPHPALGARRAPFSERARHDFSTFITQRARELRPGAQLVVAAACSGADGSSTADAFLDLLSEGLDELASEGTLVADERAAMHVPIYFRNADEWRAPFADPALPLELVDYREELLPDGLWEAFEQSGDRDAYAAAWVGWLRAFSEPLLAGALHRARPEPARRALLDELYRRTTARVARDPERARIPWTLALLHAAKR